MSSPAITVRTDVSCKNANDLLTRYNINALLVTEKQNDQDHLCGYITRQVIEKALHHKLEYVPGKRIYDYRAGHGRTRCRSG